ncbi:uncharacterized protein BX664DRAFT_319247, partial [Halteromyces radiatus]|uniref:uncharacterized protein n=1 Tax=Halteromyces radiatus TaxID=101107 RepID=UPI00222055A6
LFVNIYTYNMSDQPTTTPEVKPVPPLPESTDTTEVNPTSADTLGVEEPTTTTTTATATEESTTAPPATTDTTTATADTTAETTDTTGTSPKQHGSTLLSNFPNFLKKTFEKKQETTEMEGETTAATETTQDTPTTPPASPEKRLSRTLIDLYHKTVGKSDDHAKKEEHNETTAATATTTTTDEPGKLYRMINIEYNNMKLHKLLLMNLLHLQRSLRSLSWIIYVDSTNSLPKNLLKGLLVMILK